MTTENMEKKSGGCYWSKAERCQLANFEPEKRDGAAIIRPERPLRFTNHFYYARTKKEVDFIENSSAFTSGDVVKVADAREANVLTAKQHQRKMVIDRPSSHEEIQEHPTVRTK